MKWEDVGHWLKNNAGKSAALVGSLLTGNMPGAIAAGVAMVSSATGEADPAKALDALQTDPQTVVRLRELAVQDDENIRNHIRLMTEMELKDNQHQHETTQGTIQSGDNSSDVVVRRTRPYQSWWFAIASVAYVFVAETIDLYVLGLLMSYPLGYAGFRQVGKGIDSFNQAKVLIGGKNVK